MGGPSVAYLRSLSLRHTHFYSSHFTGPFPLKHVTHFSASDRGFPLKGLSCWDSEIVPALCASDTSQSKIKSVFVLNFLSYKDPRAVSPYSFLSL